MTYMEDLPDQCPPAEAEDQPFGPAYRILPADQVELKHFYSHHKLGKPKPAGVDDCRYMSCSLFGSEEKARAIASLPKFRVTSTHLAEINVPSGVGSSLINEKTKHIDFWPFDPFDVTVAVTKVVEL